jgi:hydroxyacylglutathione hydrolase
MPKLQIAVVPVTPFDQNCAILFDAESKRGAVIDPGGDLPQIQAALAQSGVTVEKVVGPHRADAFLLDALPETAAKYGLPPARTVTPDLWLDEGDAVEVGPFTFDILHCPGHSPGSVVFLLRQEPEARAVGGFAIVGDVLFKGSVGRSDLPGGDGALLIKSIREKLLPLPDAVAFHCGHGPMSTIGAERRTNPFLA